MKAKIKATEEIRDICEIGLYSNGDGIDYFEENEVEIIPTQPEMPAIDWEQRRYEIAKAALQAIITGVFSNKEAAKAMLDTTKKNGLQSNEAESIMAIEYADELINHLKNTPIK